VSLLGHLRALNELDLADLDLDNVGNWPLALKAILLGVLYSLILVAGFYFHVQALQQRLANTEQQEETLRQEFEQKAFEAANLDIYRAQLTEMALRFGELVAQLPSQTEVPSLLEDITGKGKLNGLRIKRIDLLEEQSSNFFCRTAYCY
jgi:type IV pilus assembly protein PilO